MKPRTAGSALIITLMLLVLLTTIILASLIKAQSSRQSSGSIMGNFSANQFAQDGVNQAVALLQYATGQTDARWISQPGRIEKLITSGTSVSSELIDLHSGLAATPADGVNLNAAMLQNPSEGVVAYDPAIQMPLSWIYIRENGSRTADATYDATNKVVGRYAFWTDDNTARVNVNTAWSADPTVNTVNSQGHPSRIPLTGAFPSLTPDDVKTVRNFRGAGGLFNTPQDIPKAFGEDFASYSTLARESKFWTTHVNATPGTQLTSFGLPKIVLTTKPERAKAADGTQLPYIDITDIAGTKERIRSYLSSDKWGPGMEGSLQAKYYSGNSDLLQQIAMNIMEYVRCKEDSTLIIKPMRASIGATGKQYAGPTRRFRMVEIGFWRSSTTPGQCRVYIVLTLPKNVGLSTFSMTKWRFVCVDPNNNNAAKLDVALNTTQLDAGKYVLISQPCSLPTSAGTTTFPYHARFYSKEFITAGYGDMIDVYPSGQAISIDLYPFPVTESAPATGDPSSPADATLVRTIKVKDPFLGGTSADWSAPGVNRFADLADANKMRTHAGLGVPPTDYGLGQDLDSDGNITDEGVILPPPAGKPGNLSGYVESLAELGRVHTGVSTVPGYAPVPWRTLRLQPRHPQATAHLNTIPDWVILDAFALPNIPGNETNALIERTNGQGGLINLNSALKPFSTVERPQALKSLLGVSTQFTEAQKTTAASSIIQQTLADSSIAKGKSAGSGLIQYPGNIVEFAGVSDEGEASEARLTGVLDLATTRSSVFTIYSVGQRVLQTSTGKLIPKGEASQLSTVERYEDSGTIKFRVILSKPLRN